MYGCESWTIKKAEHWRIDAFELQCWRRLLRVPWTIRRWNQSIPEETTLNILWKDRCWSWNSNTLATWCKEPTPWKIPNAGKYWGQEEKGATEDEMVGWHHWLNGHKFEQTPEEWWTRRPDILQSMGWQTVRLDWVTEQLQLIQFKDQQTGT